MFLCLRGRIQSGVAHSLGTFSPLELGGAKVQFLAAWIAASAKYLLGPGASNAALVTLPEAFYVDFYADAHFALDGFEGFLRDVWHCFVRDLAARRC